MTEESSSPKITILQASGELLVQKQSIQLTATAM